MIWEKRWFQFAVLFGVSLVWGSSFILVKVGLKSFDHNQAASIRIILAWIVLLPYSIRNLKKLQRKDVKPLLVAGFIGSLFPAFLFTKAQTHIDSSMAGMLNSLTPVFTVVVGIVFHKSKFKTIQFVGLVIGLLGAAGLIISNNNLNISNVNAYAFLIVLATIFYAININQIKANLAHLTGVQITSLSFFFIGPVALIYLMFSNITAVVSQPDWLLHFSALAILGVVGTALAMLFMNSLIRYTTPIFSSSVTYIIPIFAITWGLVDHEKITLFHLLCISIILTGIYLINRRT